MIDKWQPTVSKQFPNLFGECTTLDRFIRTCNHFSEELRRDRVQHCMISYAVLSHVDDFLRLHNLDSKTALHTCVHAHNKLTVTYHLPGQAVRIKQFIVYYLVTDDLYGIVCFDQTATMQMCTLPRMIQSRDYQE